ncbi:hypothetical protein RU639_012286 [Aspergillus parasiticus]
MPINMQYGLRKTPVEKFTDLKSIEMAIEALEAAQERAQEEITARAIKIQALREQGERLQQKTAMDQTEDVS